MLFRYWINVERNNVGLPKLSYQAESKIDETLRENNDNVMISYNKHSLEIIDISNNET